MKTRSLGKTSMPQLKGKNRTITGQSQSDSYTTHFPLHNHTSKFHKCPVVPGFSERCLNNALVLKRAIWLFCLFLKSHCLASFVMFAWLSDFSHLFIHEFARWVTQPIWLTESSKHYQYLIKERDAPSLINCFLSLFYRFFR